MKRRARHFWRWLLHAPLAVLSSPRSSHVARNNQLLLIVFEFVHHSSRGHPPTNINKHNQQNQQSLFETEDPPFLEITPQTLLAILLLFKIATCQLCQHFALTIFEIGCYTHR